MINTLELTLDCIRMEQQGVPDEEIVTYLTEAGLAAPMAVMMVEHAQYLVAKRVRGRNYIIAGVAAVVVGSLLAVVAFLSGFIIAVIFAIIAAGIGITISGIADLRATRHYR